MKTCTKCGEQVPEIAKVCGNCGTRFKIVETLNSSTSPKPVQKPKTEIKPPKKDKRKPGFFTRVIKLVFIVFSISALLLIGLYIVNIVFIKPSPTTPEPQGVSDTNVIASKTPEESSTNDSISFDLSMMAELVPPIDMFFPEELILSYDGISSNEDVSKDDQEKGQYFSDLGRISSYFRQYLNADFCAASHSNWKSITAQIILFENSTGAQAFWQDMKESRNINLNSDNSYSNVYLFEGNPTFVIGGEELSYCNEDQSEMTYWQIIHIQYKNLVGWVAAEAFYPQISQDELNAYSEMLLLSMYEAFITNFDAAKP